MPLASLCFFSLLLYLLTALPSNFLSVRAFKFSSVHTTLLSDFEGDSNLYLILKERIFLNSSSIIYLYLLILCYRLAKSHIDEI